MLFDETIARRDGDMNLMDVAMCLSYMLPLRDLVDFTWILRHGDSFVIVKSDCTRHVAEFGYSYWPIDIATR